MSKVARFQRKSSRKKAHLAPVGFVVQFTHTILRHLGAVESPPLRSCRYMLWVVAGPVVVRRLTAFAACGGWGVTAALEPGPQLPIFCDTTLGLASPAALVI